ncbi:DUF1376 domain-containing protein [Mesorhizobium sp. YIM 152430]|uniref:DUF1376 domain-containing protein n=1 Tax=Mesorhizobium sp. YIM 152430 TaxID=3031761 RepID=UPI0023DAA7A4|nr:DUF1376 domain-containing protein [Mesorhizobium sp. YIM 152430]MDF1601584.1 DUF1376 domain-containing protein [Mesorhizobium sp. YIM 152430]
MMKSALWFRFFPAQFLGATRALGAQDAGVLMIIASEIHLRDGAIANDPKRLARLCGMTKAALIKSLDRLCEAGHLTDEGDFLTCSMISKEIAHRTENSEKASENVRKRWGKSNENNRPSIRGTEVEKKEAAQAASISTVADTFKGEGSAPADAGRSSPLVEFELDYEPCALDLDNVPGHILEAPDPVESDDLPDEDFDEDFEDERRGVRNVA